MPAEEKDTILCCSGLRASGQAILALAVAVLIPEVVNIPQYDARAFLVDRSLCRFGRALKESRSAGWSKLKEFFRFLKIQSTSKSEI